MSDPKAKLHEAIKTFCKEMAMDKEVYLRLLSGALVDFSKEIELLRTAISAGDLRTIHRISHRIKGTASNLRLNDIVPIISELNNLSKQGLKTERYPQLFAEMETGIKAYQQALKPAS